MFEWMCACFVIEWGSRKLLMLRHAFGVLRCVRVEFKANAANAASCRAILALGATEEGTLRRHSVLPDGTWRDTTYFSILDQEWPLVERGLERRLHAKGS